MNYRDEVREGIKETRWTFFKIVPMFLLVTIFFSGLGFITHSLGLWGKTVMERKIFESSYQRSAALEAQIAVDESALAAINGQLRNPNLDSNTRFNLEAQRSAINVRLNTTRRLQQ